MNCFYTFESLWSFNEIEFPVLNCTQFEHFAMTAQYFTRFKRHCGSALVQAAAAWILALFLTVRSRCRSHRTWPISVSSLAAPIDRHTLIVYQAPDINVLALVTLFLNDIQAVRQSEVSDNSPTSKENKLALKHNMMVVKSLAPQRLSSNEIKLV